MHDLRVFYVLAAIACCICVLIAPLHPALARQMDDYPVVQLRALDKITARTLTFEAKVGSTMRFGSIYIKPQACKKASPIDAPESTAFLQIWEATTDQQDLIALQEQQAEQQEEQQEEQDTTNTEWIFSGWMFASSPALSAMDHPIYDVWVMDCLNQAKDAVKAEVGTIISGEGEVDDAVMPDLPADVDIDVEALPATVAE